MTITIIFFYVEYDLLLYSYKGYLSLNIILNYEKFNDS